MIFVSKIRQLGQTMEYRYSDELKDEFSGIKRDTITIDETYQYLHLNQFWKTASFFLYHFIMTPVAYLYLKWKFHIRFVNRKVLRTQKGSCFLYGNHTQVPGDGYIPTAMTAPKRDIVITNADNVSLKGTRTFMEMIGAYPLPDNYGAMKNFMKGLKHHISKGYNIVIYPEAHIWPYYTDIRPFTEDSFAYPVLFSKPVFCFTVTYQKQRLQKIPAMTVYIDGPFFPDLQIGKKEAGKKLRDEIYHCMKNRCKNSTYEYIHYRRETGSVQK